LGIKRSELDIYFDKSLEYKDIRQCHAATLVMKERAKLNDDTELIYDIMSVLYLREDEKNEFVDQLYLKEKSKDIKLSMRASGGVDSGFFLCQEFRNFLKSANLSDVDWSSFTRAAERNQQNLEITLNLIRNSDQFKSTQSTPKK